MKRSFSPLIPVVFVLLLFASCYYDSEEALYPSISDACDTTNVTFSVTIKTLLSNNCLSCHSNTTAAGSGNGIRLENIADVKANATAVAGAMKHTGSYSPMPKNGGMLKPCLIKQFDIWINKGMPDN